MNLSHTPHDIFSHKWYLQYHRVCQFVCSIPCLGSSFYQGRPWLWFNLSALVGHLTTLKVQPLIGPGPWLSLLFLCIQRSSLFHAWSSVSCYPCSDAHYLSAANSCCLAKIISTIILRVLTSSTSRVPDTLHPLVSSFHRFTISVHLQWKVKLVPGAACPLVMVFFIADWEGHDPAPKSHHSVASSDHSCNSSLDPDPEPRWRLRHKMFIMAQYLWQKRSRKQDWAGKKLSCIAGLTNLNQPAKSGNCTPECPH